MAMLNHFQRERIKAQVRPLIDDQHQATQNDALDAVVAEIKAQYPGCFHTEATLSKRIFYHQPKPHIECAGYMVPLITKSEAV